MTNYKLVPMEPTPEMLAEARCKLTVMAEQDETNSDVYQAMLAAAPDVRAEPVGWVWHSYNQTNFTSGSHHKEVLEANGVKLTPVYTAPQPVERRPTPGISALVEALERIARCLRERSDELSANDLREIARKAIAAYRNGVEK